jgi:hypothetical protein
MKGVSKASGSQPQTFALSSADMQGRACHGVGSTPVYVESCVDASPEAAKTFRSFTGMRERLMGHEM